MNSPTPGMEVTDLEIVRRCQRGETEAFARLIEKYQAWVRTHLYRWLGQKETVEEMAQEVFLKAFQALPGFKGEAKFSTWLFQIMLNRCRDFWRGRGRTLPKDIPFEEHISTHPFQSPEEPMAMRQEISRLRSALKSLPEIYRETLSLRYLSEMSLEEIAQAQGEGLSNIKMRVMRGLSLLRRKLVEVGQHAP